MSDEAVIAPPDNLLTPEQCKVRLGYTNVRSVWELIAPQTYGKEGPPQLAAVNMKKPTETQNRWRVFESELNRFIAALPRNS